MYNFPTNTTNGTIAHYVIYKIEKCSFIRGTLRTIIFAHQLTNATVENLSVYIHTNRWRNIRVYDVNATAAVCVRDHVGHKLYNQQIGLYGGALGERRAQKASQVSKIVGVIVYMDAYGIWFEYLTDCMSSLEIRFTLNSLRFAHYSNCHQH